MNFREAISLGVALSVNNIGLGISASISGLHVMSAAIAAFVFSLIFTSAGNFLGNSFLSKMIEKYAEPIASSGIIALGVCELFF